MDPKKQIRLSEAFLKEACRQLFVTRESTKLPIGEQLAYFKRCVYHLHELITEPIHDKFADPE